MAGKNMLWSLRKRHYEITLLTLKHSGCVVIAWWGAVLQSIHWWERVMLYMYSCSIYPARQCTGDRTRPCCITDMKAAPYSAAPHAARHPLAIRSGLSGSTKCHSRECHE
jgi:hypothetical protein